MVRLGQGAYVAFGHKILTSPLEYVSLACLNTDMKLWFRAQDNTDNLQMETDVVQFPEVSNYDAPIGAAIEGHRRVTGSVTFQTTYSYLNDLMRWITGHNAAPTSLGVYAWEPIEPNNSSHYLYGTTKRVLCIEVFRNDSGGNSTFYQGCLITRMSFRFQPNSFVEVTMEFIGRAATVTTKSTPVFKSNYLKTPTGQAAQSFLTLTIPSIASGAATGYRCNGATVTITMPFEHRYDVADTMPSVAPLQSGKREVTLEAEIEPPDSDSLSTGWLSVVDKPVTNRITTGNLTISDATGAPTRSFQLTVRNATFQPPVEPRVTGIGVIRVNFTAMAHADVGVAAYAAALSNADDGLGSNFANTGYYTG